MNRITDECGICRFYRDEDYRPWCSFHRDYLDLDAATVPTCTRREPLSFEWDGVCGNTPQKEVLESLGDDETPEWFAAAYAAEYEVNDPPFCWLSAAGKAAVRDWVEENVFAALEAAKAEQENGTG